jgi:hypothetical protein
MNDKQRRRGERGERVRDFASTLNASFPDGSRGAGCIVKIGQLVERVHALDASRETNVRASRAVTAAKGGARAELQSMLKQIGCTARTIGMDDPALKDKFRLPAGSISNQTLMSIARSFLAEATPLKDRFIAYGMSAEFFNTLGQKIESFEGHTNRQHTSASARAADNVSLDAALDELDAEIERFDTIMRNTFAADAATLAAWDVARHMERTAQKRKDAATTTGPSHS